MVIRLLLLSLAMLPLCANAEIYKWKDKDGIIRYSDVPPPSNIKNEPMLGKKIPKPTGQAPLAPVEGNATAELNKAKAAAPVGKEEAATKRAKDAETQKKASEAKQAEQKIRQANCKTGRENLATYNNGGRIMTTDDKGERHYLGDDEIAKGKADAQRDVEQFCD